MDDPTVALVLNCGPMMANTYYRTVSRLMDQARSSLGEEVRL